MPPGEGDGYPQDAEVIPNRNVGKVVLVVEDEALIRLDLVDHLEGAGFTVREASRGDVAVEVLKGTEVVDAVVTDIRMPGRMDGLGLMIWIRDNRGATPIIATSGYITEEDARKANPMAVIAMKPYAPEDIASLLMSLLGRPLQ